MKLLTGPLNQRVTLQQRASGVDALGQESSTWQDVATAWVQQLERLGLKVVRAADVGLDAIPV